MALSKNVELAKLNGQILALEWTAKNANGWYHLFELVFYERLLARRQELLA